jgi:hypothetical protein
MNGLVLVELDAALMLQVKLYMLMNLPIQQA